MSRKRTVLATWFCCLCLGLPAWAIEGVPTWKPRELVGTDMVLADNDGLDRIHGYDNYGDPGIVAVNQSGLSYYKRVPGVGWTRKTVAIDGKFPSLSYDRREFPAVAYHDPGAGVNVKFHSDFLAFDNPDVTAIGFVPPPAPRFPRRPSLAFDHLGRAVVVAERFDDEAKLAGVTDFDGDRVFFDDSVWNNGPQFGSDVVYHSLAIDPLNRPNITYVGRTEDQLNFFVQDSTQGNANGPPVDSNLFENTQPSLAINPVTGFPAIAYTGLNQDNNKTPELRFAEWSGASWDISIIDNVGDTGLYPSLAFDPGDGRPAIAYYDATRTGLRFAHLNENDSWITSNVDIGVEGGGGAENRGYYPSLAFNEFGDGFASVSYFDQAGNLFFIVDPPVAVPEPSTAQLLFGSLILLVSRRRRAVRRWRGERPC